MQGEAASHPYVLGHTDEELARLAQQAELFEGATEAVLRSAGLERGMSVLDLGCGAGDVSMIAARLVGETGSVLGIDKSDEAVRTAQRRCRLANLSNVTFAERNLEDLEGEAPFDAVIGRFILVHFKQPEVLLKRVRGVLRPGGILAFAELDIGSTMIAPPAPLFQQCLGWILAVYEKSGLDPNMGSQLYRIFRAVGLTPGLSATCRISGGEDWVGMSYLAESVRSLIPALEAFAISDAKSVGADDLAARLLSEAAAGDHCITYPRFVGAWSRTPA